MYHCLLYAQNASDKVLFVILLEVAKVSDCIVKLLNATEPLRLINVNANEECLRSFIKGIDADHLGQIVRRAVSGKLVPIIKVLLSFGVDQNVCFCGHSILPLVVSERSTDLLSIFLHHHTMDSDASGTLYKHERKLRPALTVAMEKQKT